MGAVDLICAEDDDDCIVVTVDRHVTDGIAGTEGGAGASTLLEHLEHNTGVSVMEQVLAMYKAQLKSS